MHSHRLAFCRGDWAAEIFFAVPIANGEIALAVSVINGDIGICAGNVGKARIVRFVFHAGKGGEEIVEFWRIVGGKEQQDIVLCLE